MWPPVPPPAKATRRLETASSWVWGWFMETQEVILKFLLGEMGREREVWVGRFGERNVGVAIEEEEVVVVVVKEQRSEALANVGVFGRVLCWVCFGFR